MARRPFFSGNYGSALGSTANAANLIARAGEAQGRMYANMGQQIGGMIQQYGLNKEKREAEERTAMGNLAGFSPQEITQISSSNPQLGKAIENALSEKASPKDFQLINASSAPIVAGKARRLQEENAQIKNSLNKLNLDVAEYLKDPKIRDAIDAYNLNKDLRESKREMLPLETEATKTELGTSIMRNEAMQERIPGETSLDIKKQELTSRQIDVENELLDIVGIKGYAKMKADDIKTLSETAKAKLEHTKAYADYLKNKGLADLFTAASKSSPSFKESFSPLVELSGKILTTNVKVPGSNKRVPFKEYLELHEDDANKYPLNGLPGQLNAQLKSLEKSQQEVLRSQTVQVNVPDNNQDQGILSPEAKLQKERREIFDDPNSNIYLY